MTADFANDGFVVLPHDTAVADWATAASKPAHKVMQTKGDLRHGGTWRVGVDELPNAPDGSIAGVPLRGGWVDYVSTPAHWHQAQLSVVYPGYPKQDRQDSDAAHRYRLIRDAAHVDGLLPEGPAKRRHLREAHSFILGIPLTHVMQSPLVVWKGSHRIMKDAFAQAFAGVAPDVWGDLDVTDIYHEARRQVFATCERITCPVVLGQASLVHRHTVHGVAPWSASESAAQPRLIAYFRPLLGDVTTWLA